MDAMDADAFQDPLPGRLFQDLAAWRQSSDPSLMRTLRQAYCYQPEAYLDCAQAPVVATLETGVGSRGYTVHLHLLQTNGARGAILRLITATEGIGLDICVLERDTLAVRVIPDESDWTRLTPLPPYWTSVTCVHVNVPKPVLHVYVNGAHAASVPVPYPPAERWSGQTLMVMLGGGYTGRLALCAAFGDPLPHRAVTFLHAVPVNYPPHFNEQHAFSVMGFPITVTAAYPTGGAAFPDLPRIDYAPGQMALFPRTLIWLAASAFTERGLCDPLPFPNCTIDILQGVRVEKVRNLQAAFESGGGLRLFLVAISPSFLGRRFVNGEEGADVVEMLAALMRGCVSFAYDLGVMGAITVHNLIYSWIEPQHRTLDLLQATRSLLTAVDLVDITSSKHLFLDLFTATVLDVAYWSEAGPDCQRALVDLIVPLVTPNPAVFAHAVGVEGFMHQFQYLRTKGNERLADCCLHCIGLIATSSDLPVLFRTVVSVRADPVLHNQFLHILSKLAFDDSAAFRDLVLSDTAFNLRALLLIASSTDDAASRIGLRLLGVVLVLAPAAFRASLARTASLYIEENLRLSSDVYCSLAQLLVGEISASVVDAVAAPVNIAFHDEQIVQIPELLPALFSLMSSSGDDALVDRILLDILSIIKISDRNKMSFTRNPFWQRWLLPYCDDQKTVRSQISLQILSLGVLYCLCQEDKGWVAIDQTIWLMEANASSSASGRRTPTDHAFRMRCALFLELVTQLSRSSSQEFGPDTSPTLSTNVKPTLQLIERILFEAGPSPVHDPDRLLDADMLALLERLLIAALKFLPFPDRREHIVRLVLRYIEAVLPRAESQSICPVILGAASQVFGRMLGDKSAVNLRLVQIAVSYLRAAARVLHPAGALDSAMDIERVVQSLIHVWGTAIFTDLNQQPVNATDSDRAALLGQDDGDDDAAVTDINSSLPVMLSETQIHDAAQETFGRLRSKFVSVVGNRIDKLNRMLREYSNKVAETLAAKRLSDVKAQNEFHQRLPSVSVPFTASGTAPATIQAIAQRNTYLMTRAVLALKRFRDAFEFSAERDHRDTFWRVDPTENPMRMRHLLKRNPDGDNHPGAAARPAPADAASPVMDSATASLPAVIAASSSPTNNAVDDDAAVSETEEKSAVEWPSDTVGADDDDNGDPVGFNIDRPGDAADDAVPVPSAQPLMVVSCTLISLTRKIDGEFTVFGDSLRFVGRQEHKSPGEMPPDAATQSDTAAAPNPSSTATGLGGAGDDSLPPFKPRTHFWLLRDIRQVLPRRYLLRECGMEIFTKTYRSYFFTFDRAQRTKIYKRICTLLRLPAELSNMRRLRYSGITEKWVNRQISNYEYLAHLNTIAGRTYNDITQYPVYPSIIRDFESEQLDLQNPNTFRDLSKPIGALNPERLQAFEAKYQDMVEIADPAMPPFHYGSHYLSAGIVLYYLVRLEPFTSLGIQLQGGRFDLPDRLFTSIKGAWDLSISNLSDVKELIPEFFYMPEFLRNLNRLPLGQRQDGSEVGDVLLPPWAKSAEQFLALHRAALESDYVSAHLPDWIDLIFGYKQQGPDAVAAKNVFFHLTYAGAVDLDMIKDEALRQATVAQIYHFGQTPSQLFDKPHPHQKPLEACAGIALVRARFPTPDPLRTAPDLRWAAETSVRDCALSNVVLTRADLLVHCYVDEHGDLRYRSRALSAATSATAVSVPIRIGRWSGAAALSRTGQLLLCGGLAKGALECYLCPTGRLIARAYAGHHSPITCLQIDPEQSFLISGARNGTVCLWSVFLKRHAWARPPILSNSTWTFALQGVVGPVTRVDICAGLGLAAAAFGDGTCALLSVRRKSLVRAFCLPDQKPIDLLHLTASARLTVTSGASIYLYTCNARLLRVIDWGHIVTQITSTRSGEFVIVGGRRSRRLTVHSFCEMDKVDEIEYGMETIDTAALPYPVVIHIGPKENLVVVALSDQTVFLTQIATNKEGDTGPGLLSVSADLARDIATNTLDVLRESLESPLKQAVAQVNDQIAGALDRTGAESAGGGSSNLWQSLSKVKGKLFGAGSGSSSSSLPASSAKPS